MKQIVAIIKPFLAQKILESLSQAPLEACTVREVKGFGRQKSYLDQYSESEFSFAFLPKVELTFWVDNAHVEDVVRQIVAIARTGRMGDGKILVLPALMPDACPAPGQCAGSSPNHPEDRQRHTPDE